MEKEGAILYVGGDDSNHAGTSKGEIIVSTFSFLKKDSLIQNFKNRRDYQKSFEWLKDPNRDYIYTAVTDEKYRHSSQNLIEVVPKLIEKYLFKNGLFVKQINIYLDGRLDRGSKNLLRNYFIGKNGIEKVVVDNFIKKTKNSKGRKSKHPFCPPLVYHADVIANYLNFTPSYLELTMSDKFVSNS